MIKLKETSDKIRGYHTVILGFTGSVASIIWKQVVLEFLGNKCNVIVVKTPKGDHFAKKSDKLTELEQSPSQSQRCKTLPFYIELSDDDEYSLWGKRGDMVLHIDLVNLADALVISPLSANTLAKISTGLCDNLLTCVARAWRFKKPFVVAPAMNTYMYEHPITEKQL